MGGAHRDKVVVRNRAEILVTKGHKRLRSPRCCDELHADGVRAVLFDDGAKITASQPLLRQVSRENDDIQGSNGHLLPPGYAVTKRGGPPVAGTNHTLSTTADCPLGPFRIARIVNSWPSGMDADSAASWVRCCARSAASKSCQRSAV
jgi:hypothetical protein